MPANRRNFLKLLAASAAMGSLPHSQTLAGNKPPVRAIAFDAFPIFDPRPVFGKVKQFFPEVGGKFSVLWRTRIFEYTWLLTSAGRYKDFWACIDDALVYTANHLNIKLTRHQHEQLMQSFLNLKAWPDVLPALKQFKAAGIQLGFLSNMTSHMLTSNIQHAGLAGLFDHVISTDEARTFKPDQRAYQLGPDAFGVKPDEMVFVAFASWDAIGAKWFGYPTVWVNRLGFTPEHMGIHPDKTGKDLKVLTDFVL